MWIIVILNYYCCNLLISHKRNMISCILTLKESNYQTSNLNRILRSCCYMQLKINVIVIFVCNRWDFLFVVSLFHGSINQFGFQLEIIIFTVWLFKLFISISYRYTLFWQAIIYNTKKNNVCLSILIKLDIIAGLIGHWFEGLSLLIQSWF